MSLRARSPVVALVVALVLWHGVLQVVPHHHIEADIPQEHLACRASHPLSQERHLHGAGQAMTPHPCLGCLAGSITAAMPELSRIDGVASAGGSVEVVEPSLRSLPLVQLPPSRGPPALA